MPIQRSHFQSDESLAAFYQREEWKDAYKSAAENMLAILDIFNEMFIETQLWAITSHQRLYLLSSNDQRFPWVVIIGNWGLDHFHIEYKVPQHQSPWPDAWMRGTAPSLDEASMYILKAMRNCEIWKGNEEFEGLLKKYLEV